MPSTCKIFSDRDPSDTGRAGRSPRATAAVASVPKLDWALKKVRGADKRLKTWMWVHQDALLAEYGFDRLDLEELLATALLLGLTNDRGRPPNKDVISKTMSRVRERVRRVRIEPGQVPEGHLPAGVTVREVPALSGPGPTSSEVDIAITDPLPTDASRTPTSSREAAAPASPEPVRRLTTSEKIARNVRQAQAGHQQMPRHD